jgi:hypothetical protein
VTEAGRLLAGRIAGAISAVAFVPYAVSVARRKTRPSIATWFLWTVVGAVLAASYWSTGARASVWVAAAYVAGPLVTTLLALRYGTGGFSRFEKGCLAAALVSLVLWRLSGNPLVALALNIVVDLLAAAPTVRKAWRDPASEDRLSWTLFAAGNAANLPAIEAWTFAGAAFPVYLFLLTTTMAVLSWRRPRASQS